MPAKKRTETVFQPRELETVIARARRDRDVALRNMIGTLFGR